MRTIVFAKFPTKDYILKAGDTRSIFLVQKIDEDDDVTGSEYTLDFIPQQWCHNLPNIIGADTTVDNTLWVDVSSWTIYGTNDGKLAKLDLLG
jgi:hypothetical protein